MEFDFNNLYFFEPRLKMSSAGRFLIRLVVYSGYAVLMTAAATFILSDVNRLFWLGILISLFLGDRLIHLGQAERTTIGFMRHLPRLSRRGKISDSDKSPMFNAAYYLTPAGFSILEKSYDKALVVGGDFYLHLIKFLIKLPEIKKGILRMDADADEFSAKIEEFIELEENKKIKNSKEYLFSKIENLAKSAFIQAINARNRFIEPRDLFAALLGIGDKKISRLFNLFEINSADLEKAVIFSGFNRFSSLPKLLGAFARYPFKLRHRPMNRAWTARPTPTLDKYGIDFTDLAREGDIGFLIGHKSEYGRLVDILSRQVKPNAMLIGEPGSGKETIVMALAFGIIKDEVPEAIFDKRLVSLEIGRLISGAAVSEISARLNKIAEEIILADNVILYIPDIHNLTKTFGEAMISPSDIFLPIINNDAFPVIGAVYPREYKQSIEPRSDFINAFEAIRVEEISEDDAERLLIYEAVILERKHKIIISFGAVKQAVVLAHKYFRNKQLPSSAEDLLKESLSYVSQRGEKSLQADDVIAVAERKINVPIHKTGKDEAEKLLNLEKIIHEFLIDQEPAVSVVSRALREYRSGLSRRGGPIAAFLFIGPTGVGKTELSKILARIQFGAEESMVRFDMSEYQNKESINRFIGSSDGRIAGNLTEEIIRKPYSLILLDEFEKAHPDILNLFLQVFDDGRLTDSLGRIVDFTNAVIIATSNAHSNFIKERIEAGNDIEKISEELKKKLTEYFKPELLNRFSQIVVFKNLSPDDIEAVAKLQLKSLAKTLEETNGISLDFDESVVKYVAGLGFDPVFGARPLRGVISEKLRSVLAEKILKEEIVKGDSVRAILKEGEIKFSEIK